MKLLTLCFFTLFLSCSHETRKAQKPEPVRISPSDVRSCRDYQKNVLDKAYRVSKERGQSKILFSPNNREAREFINKFEIGAGLVVQKSKLVSNILRHCDPDSLKKFNEDYKVTNECSIIFSELSYFQGLSDALKNYPWPTDLKLEGKKVALDYVTFFSEGNFPLLNRLIALSVLDELSVNEVVNPKLHSEIKTLMQESHDYVEGLRAKLKGNKELSCDSLDIIRDELNYSNQLAQKMQNFLKRI